MLTLYSKSCRKSGSNRGEKEDYAGSEGEVIEGSPQRDAFHPGSPWT